MLDFEAKLVLACQKASRTRDSVHLLAVSKNRSIQEIKALYAQGQRDFGENYAAEFHAKKEQLLTDCPNIRWHYIGQIQSNKMAMIAQADYVHSLASLKHAELLANLATKPITVFIQINLSGEIHRGGITPAELPNFIDRLIQFDRLKLAGLMAILPIHTPYSSSHWFKSVQDLKQDQYPELSMGMSEDFEEAIAYGATWIRIGRALFST